MDDNQTKAFFELVNLDYPSLEGVKAAVEMGNYTEAKDALAVYYKTRKHPGWYWDAQNKPLWSSHDDASADDVLDRKFTFLQKTAQLEKKIDWAANPIGDREWTFMLNRHQFFQTLGLAYAKTGKERYSADFNGIITDWVLSNPVPEVNHGLPHSWRTIEAGIRMLSSWPSAWNLFKDSHSFTTDARMLMLKSFAEHADYLVKFPKGGNWLLMESNGLLHVGTLFPELKDAEKWRNTAIDRLVKQMEYQVYPDGMQFELTTSYHNVSLWNMLHPVALKRIADGVDFPKEYYDSLVRMQQFNAGIMRPDGMAPMLNDSDTGDQYAKIRDQISDMGGGKVPEIKALLDIRPEEKSVFFPYSGISVMRTGCERQDLYLMMDAGPFGAGHQHEDKLNLEVYAYGRPFIVDPGRYAYTGAGGPFRAASAHNMVFVDGLGQNRRATDRSKWIAKEPAPGCRWISNDDFDYAEGVYDEGFGPENDTSVTHVRKVFFAKPEYWIVIDLLKGEGAHKFEQMWHFTPGKVTAQPGMVRTLDADGANLSIVRADGAEVRVVEGEDTPILGYYSAGYNLREPSPTAVFAQTCAAPVTFETVLYPSPAGEAIVPEMKPLICLVDGKLPAQGQVSAISIRLPEYEDIFVLCHDGDIIGKTKKVLNHEFAGEAIWLRTNKKGEVVMGPIGLM